MKPFELMSMLIHRDDRKRVQSAMRINLGSGPVGARGWTCIDRSPSLLLDRLPGAKRALSSIGLLTEAQAAIWDPSIKRGNIRSLKYSDASAEAIYSSHVLEHIFLCEVAQVLRESGRVLQRGGIIRLALPDSARAAKDLIAGVESGDPDAGRIYNERLLAFPKQRPNLRGVLRRAAGGHIHRWQPTVGQVTCMLLEAGFTDVHEYGYRQGKLPGLTDVETRENSFFLEAIRP